MDVGQIRYFLALCAEGSFTRAARRCNVAQPSLTNGIRTLENSLGGALFIRKPRVRLSPFGQMLQPHLELIWRQFELAHEAAGRHLRETAMSPQPQPRRSRQQDSVRFTMTQDGVRLRRAS
jgi:LysR family hydrogen peroxide-inducible transcriptional activator